MGDQCNEAVDSTLLGLMSGHLVGMLGHLSEQGKVRLPSYMRLPIARDLIPKLICQKKWEASYKYNA